MWRQCVGFCKYIYFHASAWWGNRTKLMSLKGFSLPDKTVWTQKAMGFKFLVLSSGKCVKLVSKIFPHGQSKRRVQLITHIHQVPKFKNIWSYISTPQYVFMSWCLTKHTYKCTTRKYWNSRNTEAGETPHPCPSLTVSTSITFLCRTELPRDLRHGSVPSRLLAGIEGSNSAGGMDGCLLWVFCVDR